MIYDLNNNRIFSGSLGIISEQAKTLSVRVECRTGYVLSATSGLAVEARLLGNVPWVDIKAAPISLSPWDGTRQTFEVRVTAGAVANRERYPTSVKVRPA